MSDGDFETSSVEFLRDLSERLRRVPVMYGTDGYDIDRLRWIAQDLETLQERALTQ